MPWSETPPQFPSFLPSLLQPVSYNIVKNPDSFCQCKIEHWQRKYFFYVYASTIADSKLSFDSICELTLFVEVKYPQLDAKCVKMMTLELV